MQAGYRIAAMALLTAYLLFCLWVGYKKKGEIKNRSDYFLAGKRVTFVLLFFTTFASFSGAGNFIGQAGRGATMGIAAYWLFIGEVALGYVLFGFVIAPHLARFKYLTMPHYISDYLCGGDLVVRKVAGLAALLPNVVWAGGQIMGLSYLLAQLFGMDYRIAVVATSVVFLYYTISGGLEAVIWTDAIQGVLQVGLAASVIIFGLKTFNFDLGVLKTSIVKMDPTHWDIHSLGLKTTLSHLFVGFFGALANPIFWNRAFAAKDVQTARKGFGWCMVVTVISVFCIIIIGMSASTFNPEVGDQALIWLVINKMPPILTVFLAIGVAGATMSTADTHLNAGAANIVVDIVDPEEKLSEDTAIKYSRYATLIAGIVAVGGAMTFPSIFDLAVVGYSICGGVLVPLFAIGFFMRDRKSEEFKSKLSIKAARIGIIGGGIIAVLFELIPGLKDVFAGGIVPALVMTTVLTLVSNTLVKPVENIK